MFPEEGVERQRGNSGEISVSPCDRRRSREEASLARVWVSGRTWELFSQKRNWVKMLEKNLFTVTRGGTVAVSIRTKCNKVQWEQTWWINHDVRDARELNIRKHQICAERRGQGQTDTWNKHIHHISTWFSSLRFDWCSFCYIILFCPFLLQRFDDTRLENRRHQPHPTPQPNNILYNCSGRKSTLIHTFFCQFSGNAATIFP